MARMILLGRNFGDPFKIPQGHTLYEVKIMPNFPLCLHVGDS